MLEVTITTARKLSAQQLNKIKQSVTKKYGQQVKFSQELDPTVLGGIKLTVGSKEIDATVKAKLTKIKIALVDQVN